MYHKRSSGSGYNGSRKAAGIYGQAGSVCVRDFKKRGYLAPIQQRADPDPGK